MAKSKNKKGTMIHGIAASEHLDSSGERIKIEGIDISSLTKDGVFNFEHQSKEASAIVGKITKAKKILKRSDCEDDYQKYFWDKIKMPYLYVAGELFDEVGHQAAKDVAAMLKYDHSNSNKDTKKLINFSIEGARLEKRGANILKCIARKVSITITPCNKVCEAEELKEDTKKSYAFGTSGHGMHNENFSMVEDLMSKAEIKESSCQIMEKTMGDYKPKRTFTPESAPDTMRTGDRISYKDRPRAKTGKEIYGEMPKEPRFKKSKKKPSGKVSIPAKEAVKEHKRLVDVLESPSKKDDKKEAKKQKEELKEYKKEVKKNVAEKVQQRSKRRTERYKRRQAVRRAPERGKQPQQQRRNISDPHKRVAIADERGATMRKGKADKMLPSEEKEMARKQRKMSSGKGYTSEDAKNRGKIREKMKMKKRFVPTNPDKFGNHGHFKSDQYTSNMRKAIAAGGMGAAPGAKVQGDSLKRGMAYSAANSAEVGPAKPGSFSMGKSETYLIRKPENINWNSVEKASKNVRMQRRKVWGSKSQPGKQSAMREKHMQHIKNFVDKHLGLDLNPSGGKISEETGERRDPKAKVGVDKPDWRSGKFESQWNPEAAVHEIAHIMLLPEGVGLEEGQRLMDKQYSDVQRKHGYMKQKRSQHEVQPMAAEQLIRRAMGLPASQVSVPVKDKEAPPRVDVEEGRPIATRVKQGKTKSGEDKYVDLIRQAKNLHPENRERLHKIFTGQVKFHPDHGWVPSENVDAKINRRDVDQIPSPSQTDNPENVVPMRPREAPQTNKDQSATDDWKQRAKIAVGKSEAKMAMKILSEDAFNNFSKREQLIEFLSNRLPKLKKSEIEALAKTIAYVHEKKKELRLKKLIDG